MGARCSACGPALVLTLEIMFERTFGLDLGKLEDTIMTEQKISLVQYRAAVKTSAAARQCWPSL